MPYLKDYAKSNRFEKCNADFIINEVVNNPEGVVAKRFKLYIELGKMQLMK